MVRNFDERPVDPDVLARILRNAQRAPSAGHSQGWGFLVLEDAADRERFWSSQGTKAWTYQSVKKAPVLIVCLSNKEQYLARYAEQDKGWTDKDESRWPVPYWHIDTGFAAMLILLSAVDAGLGALFFGVPPDQTALREAFAIPADYTAIGVIALGHPQPDVPSPSLKRGRRPEADVVHRGRW